MDKNFPWSIKYDPNSKKPFIMSRSKIDLFMECPKCFYLDRRIGIQRPPGYPFSLNNAVKLAKDSNFKKSVINKIKKNKNKLFNDEKPIKFLEEFFKNKFKIRKLNKH